MLPHCSYTPLFCGIAKKDIYQQFEQFVGSFRAIDFTHRNVESFLFDFLSLTIFQVGVAPSEFLLFFVRHLQFLEVYVHVGSPVLSATAIADRNATAKAILANRFSFQEDFTEPTTTAW